MSTVRYRLSTNWEKEIVKEFPTKLQALQHVWELTNDKSRTVGDKHVDGVMMTTKEIESEMYSLIPD